MYLEVRLGTLLAKLGNHLRYHCLERTTCPTWRVKIVSGHNMTALCLISFYFVRQRHGIVRLGNTTSDLSKTSR